MPAQLFGDEMRIKQILINVLNNAVKYTSEGSVTLSIQCKKLADSRAQIIYSIADTGIGIKKENIPYLFNAFKRVDEGQHRYIEGTGLGLSIVKSLVELMGGDVAVNSVYMEGSTFVITLPQEIVGEAEIGELDLETRHELNRREYYKQIFEAPRAQVLFVDDNETNLMVARKLLRDTKVRIDTAASGQECLSKTLQSRYDVIFMDHLMPEMDGIECFRAIRGQTGGLNQNTPVVILTANTVSESQTLYKREGFDGYLLKPVSGMQLEDELLRHLPQELVTMKRAEVSVAAAKQPVLSHRRKIPIMISADSLCDLPRELIRKHQIAVMPYRVLTEGGEFMDGVETGTEGILSYMATGRHVRAGVPEVSDYEAFFASQLAKAQYIIHISAAQTVSQGYKNALEAAKIFDNVVVVDSGHLCSGMGLAVLRAAEQAAAGLSADAIADEVRQLQKRIRSSFIVDNTEYLANTGKISARVDAVCRTFLLNPVMVLKNGSMKVGGVKVGSRDSVRQKYIASALGVKGEIDRKLLFVTYAGLTREELNQIREQVKRKIAFERIIFQKASPAVAMNCGPGAFGLFFMMK